MDEQLKALLKGTNALEKSREETQEIMKKCQEDLMNALKFNIKCWGSVEQGTLEVIAPEQIRKTVILQVCSHRKGSTRGSVYALRRSPARRTANIALGSKRNLDPPVRKNQLADPEINVRRDVEKQCCTCDYCVASKGPRKRTRGRLQLYNVGAPFEQMAFDILGPLPRSSDENNILVVIDFFTKWPEAFPIPYQKASTVAETLMQH
ncbi:retrovirus-related Pol polyprotein from transposon 412 [Trichonephila clavipes]|nr:retrovirus-related Pol polyprotein from transposon 412 [Trichonephila clavipes]